MESAFQRVNININNQRRHSLNINKNNIGIDGINTKNNIGIELKAKELCSKLGSDPERSLKFYCMAFHKLPEATVQRLAGLARDPGVRNPGAYFNMLVRRELS